MLKWEKLLNSRRRKPSNSSGADGNGDQDDVRTEFERDHDRILFSAPVRRLSDKTQVFPLEPNDSVRTRLTHSNEVANLARSIGIRVAFKTTIITNQTLEPKRNIPALLAAIGLAHDLGNPPFGHQGEESIRGWFIQQQKAKEPIFAPKYRVTQQQQNDYFKFDGNAQTFRLITRLHILNDNYGLDLTYGTLAALMKYTVPSGKANKNSSNASMKKHGFFYSELDIVKEVWKKTGLREGIRHPLTYIMESCDDIAYSVGNPP